jgi:3-carboxy-cis,cis-muconate cycloisomerase
VSAPRFEMLLRLYGDEHTTEIFSERSLVQSWLDVEVALALSQAELGLVNEAAAESIAATAKLENIDLAVLWSDARTVGYPILPLVRQIDAALLPEHRGWVHFGATTQDVMDTGLALQLRAAAHRMDALLETFGDCLANLAASHETTVTAARTHAQLAVPTVLGAKFAVYLAEVARHRVRLASVAHEVGVVSLFGAGGTSAAYGDRAHVLRRSVADRLGLRSVDIPWHVARDCLAAFASAEAAMAATAARFAREVIDLSRTEIGEMAEAGGYLRGASSTMPQKSNPIESEGIIGVAASAEALSVAMLRAMEAGHERAAGEWQIEWQVLPQLVCLCSSALLTAGTIADGLRIFPDRMRDNLRLDGGLVMAEAYMMRLAPVIGREEAHELVYEAARLTRESGRPLIDVLRELSPGRVQTELANELLPEAYLGDPKMTIAAALESWHAAAEPSQRQTSL